MARDPPFLVHNKSAVHSHLHPPAFQSRQKKARKKRLSVRNWRRPTSILSVGLRSASHRESRILSSPAVATRPMVGPRWFRHGAARGVLLGGGCAGLGSPFDFGFSRAFWRGHGSRVRAKWPVGYSSGSGFARPRPTNPPPPSPRQEQQNVAGTAQQRQLEEQVPPLSPPRLRSSGGAGFAAVFSVQGLRASTPGGFPRAFSMDAHAATVETVPVPHSSRRWNMRQNSRFLAKFCVLL